MASTAIRSLPIPMDPPPQLHAPSFPRTAHPAPSAVSTTTAGLSWDLPQPGSKFWAALAVILMHALLLIVAFTYRHHFTTTKAEALQVLLLPPLSTQQAAAQEPVPEFLEIPPVVVPPPVFEIRERPPTITAVVKETPPPTIPTETRSPDKSPQAEQSAPVALPEHAASGDLAATVESSIPPRYPVESRRLKEQGTVTLNVLVAETGRVEAIKVESSSGYKRLDQAALQAVRKWTWHPYTQNGQPMKVRGIVEIPFILMKRS